ncbi:MAG: emp24/gp25L/p24 family protein, partial [Actinobacteria bacterium]|nr:emp24/gp25L/p24 family protein [Actinomycetota bacterium]
MRPGSTSFSVSGLSPNEQVELIVRRPNGEIITHRSQADAKGVFEGTISVKEEQPTGEYQVHITGLESQKSWKGVFTVTTVPESSTDTSLITTETAPPGSETALTNSETIHIETRIVEISDDIRNIGESLQSLQGKVNSLENQIKTSREDQKVINWFVWWWQIGFWTGIFWIFPWIFVGWQWTRFKFWRFGWPWPWWFWIPIFWFIPWLVIAWQWWLIWWVWWVWIWWFFPWVFWAFWWVIIFKEAMIWLWL